AARAHESARAHPSTKTRVGAWQYPVVAVPCGENAPTPGGKTSGAERARPRRKRVLPSIPPPCPRPQTPYHRAKTSGDPARADRRKNAGLHVPDAKAAPEFIR